MPHSKILRSALLPITGPSQVTDQLLSHNVVSSTQVIDDVILFIMCQEFAMNVLNLCGHITKICHNR
jgi:hypothetical protein